MLSCSVKGFASVNCLFQWGSNGMRDRSIHMCVNGSVVSDTETTTERFIVCTRSQAIVKRS